jgi:hypothetical protein
MASSLSRPMDKFAATVICPKCGIPKSLNDFYKDASRKDGHYSHCKQCSGDATQRWAEAHVEAKRKHRRTSYRNTAAQVKARNLQKNYKITFEEITARLARQGGCAICHTQEPGSKGWCVDHDHACCSGKRSCGACVRGILCGRCNAGLAFFRDSITFLRSAIFYLVCWRLRK